MQHDPSKPRPILRPMTGPAGEAPDPTDGPFVVERLTALAHELGNLLDGSMRCLSLAHRVLSGGRGEHALDDALRRIDTAMLAMERMSDLVHAAMKGSASVVGSPNLLPSRPITLPEAIDHAAEVLRPLADRHGAEITISVVPEAGRVHVGPLYSVVLNGIRNAIESIARVAAPAGTENRGYINISVSLKPRSPSDEPDIDLLLIEIADDGRGFAGSGDPNQAFDLGFTTKPGSLGVGLALSREVVREAGGSIELARRADRADPSRPGAVLRIVFPVIRPEPETEKETGR